MTLESGGVDDVKRDHEEEEDLIVRKWHASAAIITGCSFGALLLLSFIDTPLKTVDWDIFWPTLQETLWSSTNIVNTNSTNSIQHTLVYPHHIANVPILYFSIIFMAIATLHHSILAWPTSEILTRILEIRCNYIRWLEYMFSISFMRLLMGFLLGITDTWLLFGIIVITITQIYLAYLCEAHFGLKESSQHDSLITVDHYRYHLRAFIGHWIPLLFLWPLFLALLIHGRIEVFPNSLPTWFILLIVLMLFFDLCFALILFGEIRGYFIFYGTTDMYHTILSLTSKSCLAWISYACSR